MKDSLLSWNKKGVKAGGPKAVIPPPFGWKVKTELHEPGNTVSQVAERTLSSD